MTPRTLEVRVKSAKDFLNTEISILKSQEGRLGLSLEEVSRMKDKLHEAERTGYRNMTDTDFIRVERVLNSVEALKSRTSDN